MIKETNNRAVSAAATGPGLCLQSQKGEQPPAGGVDNRRSGWFWIPTLYFAEGIPYFIVNNISVIMFTNMGMSKGDMAMYTSLLYLPWVIKPLWSPFVDLLKTKRWWILAMQVLMSVAFAAAAFSLPHPSPDVIASGNTPVPLFAVTLALFWLTALASATHDIAADGFYMLALNTKSQSLFVGIRSTFYRLSSIFGQGVLVVIAGLLETRLGDIPQAWFFTMLGCSLIFSAITLYHTFFLPRPSSDREVGGFRDKHRMTALDYPEKNNGHTSIDAGSRADGQMSGIIKEFARTFRTFFTKPQIGIALLFMLLYRLPEAFLVKMMNPFLLDPVEKGGLGLSTEMVGVVYGTIGVAALTAGGIVGGIAASKWGLKKSLWPMALSLTLPCLAFVFLSAFQPSDIRIVSGCVLLDQFGYGFGFTAYMLYMMYFSEGEFKTSHYSICTAFMAMSMMFPGMVAGYLQEILGYYHFFWLVIVCCLVTVAVTFLIKVDPAYGRK